MTLSQAAAFVGTKLFGFGRAGLGEERIEPFHRYGGGNVVRRPTARGKNRQDAATASSQTLRRTIRPTKWPSFRQATAIDIKGD